MLSKLANIWALYVFILSFSTITSFTGALCKWGIKQNDNSCSFILYYQQDTRIGRKKESTQINGERFSYQERRSVVLLIPDTLFGVCPQVLRRTSLGESWGAFLKEISACSNLRNQSPFSIKRPNSWNEWPNGCKSTPCSKQDVFPSWTFSLFTLYPPVFIFSKYLKT